MTIFSNAPTRVDLAGGTLDITPLTQILKNKKTVNFGVNLYASVAIDRSNQRYSIQSNDQNIEVTGNWKEVISANKLPLLEKLLGHFWDESLPPLKIQVMAKSPAGAGLGGSSCLSISMAGALLHARKQLGVKYEFSEYELIQQVQDLETSLIKVPTGCQDYWGGLRGGLNIISYPAGRVLVETLRDDDMSYLRDTLILCYSGVSRASATNNWAIFKKAFDGDSKTIATLEEIGSVSEELASCVQKGNWSQVFKLSENEWDLRKKLWSDIETVETRRIAEAAKKAGAFFSRICGAGGGGVMAIFADPEKKSGVIKNLESAGGRVLDGTVCSVGLEINGELS